MKISKVIRCFILALFIIFMQNTEAKVIIKINEPNKIPQIINSNNNTLQPFNSQDSIIPDTVLKLIKTTNGDEILGKITSINPKETTVLLMDGRTIIIPSYLIQSIESAPNHQVKNGEFFYPNPHPSRYFYTPSALPMNKGELYLQSMYFLTMQVQYGVTKNLSLGFVTSIIGLPILGTAKYSFKLNKINTIAIGGQFGSLSWASPSTQIGTGFASYTLGNKEENITIAGGFFSNSNLQTVVDKQAYFDQNTQTYHPEVTHEERKTDYYQAYSMCGNKRLSKNMSLMAEFWYLPYSKVFFGGPCLRLFNNKKATFDFGVWIATANQIKTKIPFPVFSYTYKFDK